MCSLGLLVGLFAGAPLQEAQRDRPVVVRFKNGPVIASSGVRPYLVSGFAVAERNEPRLWNAPKRNAPSKRYELLPSPVPPKVPNAPASTLRLPEPKSSKGGEDGKPAARGSQIDEHQSEAPGNDKSEDDVPDSEDELPNSSDEVPDSEDEPAKHESPGNKLPAPNWTEGALHANSGRSRGTQRD